MQRFSSVKEVNQQEARIQGKLEDYPTIKCPGCGGETFQACAKVRKVSAIMNSSGQDLYYHVPVMVCTNAECRAELPDRL